MALQSTTALATITLQEASSTVEFSGIPDTYRDLIVVTRGKRTTDTAGVLVYLNGDTTQSNYSRVAMYGNGVDDLSFSNNEPEFVYMDSTDTLFKIEFIDASATDKHKALIARSDEPAKWTFAIAGRWGNTSRITSIEFASTSGSFIAGTTFALFGRIS